jgi:hypothetical protein
MRTSEQTTTLIAALVVARQAFTPIMKEATGQVGKDRPYKYADLNAILEATVPALLVNGIAILQAIDAESSSLITRIQHAPSGEWVEAAYPLKLDLRPQELGSLITYARRYSLLGLLCVAAEDDDGADAAKGKPAPTKPVRKSNELITPAQRAVLWDTAKRAGWSSVEYKRYLQEVVGVASSNDVFANNYDDLLTVFGMPFDPQGDHA